MLQTERLNTFDIIELDLALIDEKNYPTVHPDMPVKLNETVIGGMSPTLKKLSILWRAVDGEQARAHSDSMRAMLVGDDAAMQEHERSEHALARKSRLLEGLFWYEVGIVFDILSERAIGIRYAPLGDVVVVGDAGE